MLRRPLIAALLLLAACGPTTQIVSTNPSPRLMHPRPLQEVQIFTSSRPAAPFVEVAIIRTRQSTSFSGDMPEIIQTMREEAAKIGCDAVLINGASNEVIGGGNAVGTLEGFVGTCIVYTSAPVAAPAPAPVPPPAPVAATPAPVAQP